jgi:hypothetical protein
MTDPDLIRFVDAPVEIASGSATQESSKIANVDSATYVFGKPGTYLLPAIQVPWFDADKGTQKTSTAPEIAVSIAETPAPVSDLAPPQPQTAEPDDQAWTRIFIWLVACAAVALAISWLWYMFGPRLRDRWCRRHEAWEASEAAAFERLRHACSAGDRSAAYKELGSWARREGLASLRALCEREPTLRRCDRTGKRSVW